MPNTYTQIYIHYVFVVGNRECLIKPDWESELFRYITGIVKNEGHKLLAINGMPDHIHIFVNLRPSNSISKLAQIIKSSSTKWINSKSLIIRKFNWQLGFGAFSYSRSQINSVIKYIMNQKEHHRVKTFREEYIKLLNKFDVTYDDKYLFNWIE